MNRSILLVCGAGLLAETLCDLIGEVEPGIEVNWTVERDPGRLDPAVVGAAALVIVDLDHIGIEGGQAVIELAKCHAATGMVVIGNPETPAVVDRLLAGGARGYIPKSLGREAFLGVLRLILTGVAYRPVMSAEARDDAAATVPWAATRIPSLARDFRLTPAEIAVLGLGARGFTNREVADARGRTEGVVRIQFNAIFRKLGVRNRAEATLIALRCEELIGSEWGERLGLNNLLAHVAHRRCKADEVLFRRGDHGEEVFVVQRGLVLLPEIGVQMHDHDVFGEIGAFSPGHCRTCSAICVTATDLFVIPPDVARRAYCLDPRFAVFIRDLLTQRLPGRALAERQ